MAVNSRGGCGKVTVQGEVRTHRYCDSLRERETLFLGYLSSFLSDGVVLCPAQQLCTLSEE